MVYRIEYHKLDAKAKPGLFGLSFEEGSEPIVGMIEEESFHAAALAAEAAVPEGYEMKEISLSDVLAIKPIWTQRAVSEG